MKNAEEILNGAYSKIAKEILKDAYAKIEQHQRADSLVDEIILQAMHEYASQSQWVKVDKDNLPTCEVLAINDRKNILVGYLNYTYGVFTCSDEHQQLPYVTHYQIPTDPKD